MGLSFVFVYELMVFMDFVGMVGIVILGFIVIFCLVVVYCKGEVVIVVLMQYSQIFWVIVFGIWFFNEYVMQLVLIGFGLVIISGFYIVVCEVVGGQLSNKLVIRI